MDHFDEVQQGLQQAVEGLRVTAEGLTAALRALPPAREEAYDWRDHATKLEQMIIELTAEVRQLRAERNGNGTGGQA